ncbi:MAG: YggS family pyridoxal phosphate-dependent enzyme [Gammaproteobacteria bacterium]|nr:YggS family pyridoxal phosphate-dependent enzyme [Gammaproteobacteria bacterium]MCD8542452.1 YggS family pyridoxal phosphate-dependent enzyme [Gammaproteobacteria bacterium]
MISDNIREIKERLFVLAKHRFHSEDPVTLLAVSKTRSISDIEAAIQAGQCAFGENYLQEAYQKIEKLKKYRHLEWHYIGKIQKRKINRLAQYFDWIQTLTSEDEATKLNAACEKLSKKIQVCLQVNISNESQKNGMMALGIIDLANYIIACCPFLSLRGLMVMGGKTNDHHHLSQIFQQARTHYDRLKMNASHVDTLSMGMSHDMVTAIESGATMVRIGTAIFGERPS